MTPAVPMTVADVLDAVAYAKAYASHDQAGQRVLLDHGDPLAMLQAVTCPYVGALQGSDPTGADAVRWLDRLAEQITTGGLPGASS